MKDNLRIHILLADPLAFERPALSTVLRTNYRVSVRQTVEEAVQVLLEDRPTMIIIDAGEQNMEFLSFIEEYDKQIPLLLVGQHPHDEYAGDGFNRSALKMWIEQTITSRQLLTQVASLESKDQEVQSFGKFVTCSRLFVPIFHTLQRVAEADVPILITGESGTGKELIAQGIHYRSGRKDEPFVAPIALPFLKNLLETELFGYEKGAFTGATTTKIGKLEYAARGTVFLDEIGDMPLLTQAKLLRALQERIIERVGGNKPVFFKARIIAATNKNLPDELIAVISAKTFSTA